ncbi:DUF676 domain-containing protein [Citrus sinensis]|uniref:uncharacterized protein LOC18054169 isoform X2 n=1 Tax=Citrus clementina TaxID=85681 RepID=UPI000CED30CC|nr:uncharacterized protein LOC18054169 isoform X2 [Citrus x clementina]XP_024953410.1 uncharacterized protein LOC102622547 isoform X2 [Citrus sinensis]KAH9654052.1 DUF676 domain-containing protein [Citrus sinensis]
MIGANFSPIQTAPPISTLNRPFNLQLLSSFLSRRRKKINAAVLISVDRSEMDWIRRFSVGCFSDRRSNKDFKMEADSGGVDVFSTYAKPPPEHLIIMVNGLIGSAADWRFAAEQFVKKVPDKVLAVVKRRPEVQKISFVAHSLGGLIARYAIGRLYEHSPEHRPIGIPKVAGIPTIATTEEHRNDSVQSLEHPCKARIAGLEPMNFVTFATPHLGSKGHKQLPILCGLPFLERRASQTAHLVAGRTGKHLFLNDRDDGKPPLLLQMVNDSDNLKFISALRAFKRRVAYANANYDHMVGWRTSSIRRQHELPPKSDLLITDERYPHIVRTERETMDNIRNKASSVIGDQSIDLEEKMIRGLTQVPWERVDVSFHKSRQRYVAHNTIQVKSYWMNSDGTDVVFHMIDNFLL